MIPKEEADPTVLAVALESLPHLFAGRRLAGIADDVEPVEPIRSVSFRFDRRLGRFVPSAAGEVATLTSKCDARGRPVIAISGPHGDVAGWALGCGSAMLDPGDVVEFWRRNERH